jgi:mxaA protein
MSPLREIIFRRNGASLTLQPDVVPSVYTSTVEQLFAAGSTLVGVVALGALAWLRGWRFGHKRHRPFGEAARGIEQSFASSSRAESYLAALRTLHRAFDEAAGCPILADDLATFLVLRPEFRRVAKEIADFFMASRYAFFGTGVDHAITLLSAANLEVLAERLAKLESAGA